jgi:mono/diheme cytochrome c family protein
MEKRMAVLACAVMALAMTTAAQLSPAGEGRRLYLANNCYGCHGGRAGGGDFGFTAPEFRDEKAELGDLTEVLREGGESGMPAFPNLTATDINNLYAYFQSLRTSAEPTFNDWWVPVPTATNRRSRIGRLYAALAKPVPARPGK